MYSIMFGLYRNRISAFHAKNEQQVFCFHSAQEEMERPQAKAKTTAEAKPEPAAESAEETKAA